jgi:hypothetical protein
VKNLNQLEHVAYGVCEDPDCEIHHPEVAIEEEVIGGTELAFYLAGAQALRYYLVTLSTDEEHDGMDPTLTREDVEMALAAVRDNSGIGKVLHR